MLCPCCGSEMAAVPPDELRRVPLPRLQREVLSVVLMRYPAPTNTETMIDQIYQLDPNGGPLNPRNNIGVYVHHINRAIKPYGWRIDALGRDRRVLRRLEVAQYRDKLVGEWEGRV